MKIEVGKEALLLNPFFMNKNIHNMIHDSLDCVSVFPYNKRGRHNLIKNT